MEYLGYHGLLLVGLLCISVSGVQIDENVPIGVFESVGDAADLDQLNGGIVSVFFFLISCTYSLKWF